MQDINIENYVRKYKLDEIVPYGNKDDEDLYYSVKKPSEKSYPPIWEDLVFYHKLCIDRKVTTVLEFGVGHSSVIFADALKRNQELHQEFVQENIRRENPFELHSVDDSEKYIRQCDENFPKSLKKFFTPHYTKCEMTTFNDRICTKYAELPNLCPDLILLDAPSQFTVVGHIDGIHSRSSDRLPMSCDLLRIEHYLLPGTMIIVDGRTANARFLKTNFQRNWEYKYLENKDFHIFELKEKPLGKFNKRQIDYCLGTDWIESF